MRRADRLFRIVQLLRRRKRTTAKELAEALEVSERTIYRDVADLVATGVRIRGEAGMGYVIEHGFDLPPLMFTDDELEALVLGARVVQSWGDETLAQAARVVVGKVEAVVPARLQERMQRAPLFAPAVHVPADSTRELAAWRKAIYERRKVIIEYVDAAAAQSNRVIRPLALLFWGSAWTVAAWCELRRDFRGFRLDRVERLWETDETFCEENGRTLADFLSRERRAT